MSRSPESVQRSPCPAPRVLWIAPAVGLAVAALASLVLAIYAGMHLGVILGVLMFLGGLLFFGFFGLWFGLGVGAILYSPKCAGTGAILACILIALLVTLSDLTTAADHPGRVPDQWLPGLMLFSFFASWGAGVGALYQSWRDEKRRRRITIG